MLRNESRAENYSADTTMFLRGRAFWADRLGISTVTLIRAFRRGELKGIRIGDRVLHSPEQVEQWLDCRLQRQPAADDVAREQRAARQIDTP